MCLLLPDYVVRPAVVGLDVHRYLVQRHDAHHPWYVLVAFVDDYIIYVIAKKQFKRQCKDHTQNSRDHFAMSQGVAKRQSELSLSFQL